MKYSPFLTIVASLFAFLFSLSASAQFFPEGFKYQAVLRDDSGEALANSPVNIRLTIQWAFFGIQDIYREVHESSTNEYGLVNLVIGEGSADIGVFSEVTWSAGFMLKVEVDSGTGYVDLGTETIQAVPYAMKAKENWGLSGNSGTNITDNYIGTADNVALKFRVNSQGAGSIDPLGPTFLGYEAGISNTELTSTAFGYHALNNNTGANNNTAIGHSALEDNYGANNTACGSHALAANVNGGNNVAVGYNSLNGFYNGNYNTATGSEALHFNSGNYNTANGYGALGGVSFGGMIGDNNTAIGARALNSHFNGSSNTAVGKDALYAQLEASGNTAVGYGALGAIEYGSSSVAFGFDAGGNQTMGAQCTFLGYSAEGSVGTFSNATAIGYNASVNGSNKVRIGNSSVTEIGGYAPWTDVSDGRFKKNIGENVSGLDFIMKLRPVTYNLEVNKLAAYLKEDEHRDSSGAKVFQTPDAFTVQSRDAKEQILYTGFIAQEVEQAAISAGYDFSGVSKPENEEDLYGLRYSEFVVPLVKAVQEQQQQIEQLKRMIEEQQKLIEKGNLNKN